MIDAALVLSLALGFGLLARHIRTVYRENDQLRDNAAIAQQALDAAIHHRNSIAADHETLLTSYRCVLAERDESLARERELIASRYEMQLELDAYRQEAETREEFRRILGRHVAN